MKWTPKLIMLNIPGSYANNANNFKRYVNKQWCASILEIQLGKLKLPEMLRECQLEAKKINLANWKTPKGFPNCFKLWKNYFWSTPNVQWSIICPLIVSIGIFFSTKRENCFYLFFVQVFVSFDSQLIFSHFNYREQKGGGEKWQ